MLFFYHTFVSTNWMFRKGIYFSLSDAQWYFLLWCCGYFWRFLFHWWNTTLSFTWKSQYFTSIYTTVRNKIYFRVTYNLLRRDLNSSLVVGIPKFLQNITKNVTVGLMAFGWDSWKFYPTRISVLNIDTVQPQMNQQFISN